jgi:hypothetical protein
MQMVQRATFERRKHVAISYHHGPFGDNADRRGRLGQGFNRPTSESIAPLDRLIGIGRRAERHVFALPCRAIELTFEHLDEVALHQNHGRKLVAGIQLELRVIPSREAVVTGMRASAVRIQRPREERHALHAVQRRPAIHLLIGGIVSPLFGLGERADASVAHAVGDTACGESCRAELKELQRRHDSLFVRRSWRPVVEVSSRTAVRC